jgi:4-diphosphocytidyl-2-C-methyl-D-erythritol kinase
MNARVTIVAPAKLTLSLRVVGMRDDGYHLIDAEMTTLDLHDEIDITPTDTDSELSFSGPFSGGIPTDSTNLVARALTLAGRTARVRVVKNIPHGGGLGGGSADAAAVLRWAGFTDLVAASRLGADIPFCMVRGRARVRGIGESIEPLPDARDAHTPDAYTLVIPPLTVSTPAVYRAWDELGGPRCERNTNPNDLEEAALNVEPALAVWRDRIRDASGAEPVLAGSGATWFLKGRHEGLALRLPEATVVETTGC